MGAPTKMHRCWPERRALTSFPKITTWFRKHFLRPPHRFASFSSETDETILKFRFASLPFNLRRTLPLAFPDFQCRNHSVFNRCPHRHCSDHSHPVPAHFSYSPSRFLRLRVQRYAYFSPLSDSIS